MSCAFRPEQTFSLADLIQILPAAAIWDQRLGRVRQITAEDATAFREVTFSGITQSTLNLQPGDLFAALAGQNQHGAKFIAAASERGCAAVLTDYAGLTCLADRPAQSPPSPPAVLVFQDARSALMTLMDELYHFDKLRIFAITGTNGKTSSIHIAASILETLQLPFAISSTVERRIGSSTQSSSLTTPEVTDLYAHLAAAQQAKAFFFGLEVSSHALARHRLGSVRMEVTGFTNLTPEHMEEHGDMENYYQAKKQLFSSQRTREAVINIDTSWGQRLAQEVDSQVTTISCTGPADWQIQTEVIQPDLTRLLLLGPNGQRLETAVHLVGEMFAVNAAIVIVMLTRLGIELGVIAQSLPDGIRVALPARMEVFQRGISPRVIVDHGHTIDAVEKSVLTAKSLTRGRLITIINADGERDKSKRSALGSICGRHSDELFITDGHCRFEDPAQIRRMILEGVQRPDRLSWVHQIGSMTEAVRQAIALAGPDDTVLCAGFGDDPYLDVRGEKIPYSLRDEVRAALAEGDFAS